MDRSDLALVIPAFNERSMIRLVVEKARVYGLPIVVDDGSTDDTGACAAAAGADVVYHERNRGYDAAIESGFRQASELGCKYVITLDADGQHEPAFIKEFLAALDTGADVVLGVRDCKQRISEHVFGWFARASYGILDPLCGMKGYRMSVYRKLGHFDSYRSVGTELALYAARRGASIRQIRVPTYRRTGNPRFGRRIASNLRILRALCLGFIRDRCGGGWGFAGRYHDRKAL